MSIASSAGTAVHHTADSAAFSKALFDVHSVLDNASAAVSGRAPRLMPEVRDSFLAELQAIEKSLDKAITVTNKYAGGMELKSRAKKAGNHVDEATARTLKLLDSHMLPSSMDSRLRATVRDLDGLYYSSYSGARGARRTMEKNLAAQRALRTDLKLGEIKAEVAPAAAINPTADSVTQIARALELEQVPATARSRAADAMRAASDAVIALRENKTAPADESLRQARQAALDASISARNDSWLDETFLQTMSEAPPQALPLPQAGSAPGRATGVL